MGGLPKGGVSVPEMGGGVGHQLVTKGRHKRKNARVKISNTRLECF